MSETDKQQAGAGVGVDRFGRPVVDPTKNVEDALKTAVDRQDDLREAERRLTDAKVEALERMVALRATHRLEIDTVRDKYEEQLRLAEAKRIDAIRAVDVNAVAVASQRAADQASVLANQVTTSADALRTLVATTAATVAQAQQQLGNSLSDRLSKVEQAQYAGGGKVAGIGSIGALIVGVVVVIGTIFAIISFFASGNGKVAQVQAAPQVVYVPAPAGSLLPTTPPQAAPR